jgi:hypothetical protein
MKRREFITLLGGALGIVRENRDDEVASTNTSNPFLRAVTLWG